MALRTAKACVAPAPRMRCCKPVARMLAPAKHGCAEWSTGRSLRESDFFPDIEDLPDLMTEAEFKRRRGSVGQPACWKMRAKIERRVEALPLYRLQTPHCAVVGGSSMGLKSWLFA